MTELNLESIVNGLDTAAETRCDALSPMPKCSTATAMPEREHEPDGQCVAMDDVQIDEELLRLAEKDTNVAALVGWNLPPSLDADGNLVLSGYDALDEETRRCIDGYLNHTNPAGEPRRERVVRALKTGKAAMWIC